MFLRLAVIAISAGVVTAGSHAHCDADIFSQCQAEFDDFLRLDRSDNWENPMALATAIQNIYISGSKNQPGEMGIIAVCNAYNLLLQCLQSDGFTADGCFNPLWLMEHDKKSPFAAYFYAGVMNLMKYQCGAGFYPAVDNWKCVQSVYQNQNATLHSCIKTFFVNAGENPMKSCSFFKNGIECYESAFRHCREEVTYYGCESFRVLANTQYAGCNEVCEVRHFFGEAGAPKIKDLKYLSEN